MKRTPEVLRSEVQDFFWEEAAEYDSHLLAPYWAYSNKVLRRILRTYLGPHLREARGVKILDAGGGTGTWAEYVGSLTSNSDVTLLDMSRHMINVAWRRARQAGVRFRLIENFIEGSGDCIGGPFDITLCLHNVIGFCERPLDALEALVQHVSADGLALVMAPNYFHSLHFNLLSRNYSTATVVREHRLVRFKRDMPYMHCFTPSTFRGLLCTAGFLPVEVIGFPLLISPGSRSPLFRAADHEVEWRLRNVDVEQLVKLDAHLSMNPQFAALGRTSLLALCTKSDRLI